MIPASSSRIGKTEARLMVLNAASGLCTHTRVADLLQYLNDEDLFVVNDAATLPASLVGMHLRSGREIEIRLARNLSSTGELNPSHWQAIVLGKGSWRERTEDREAPPELVVGDELKLAHGLTAYVRTLFEYSNRICEIEFEGNASSIWTKIYRGGRPIQYSYLRDPLELWDQQTLFAGMPAALEPPSAAFQLNWGLIQDARARGIEVVSLTHSAGISSTGDEVLDHLLPLPERYWISETTARAISHAQRGGRRIIAVGTSVTRALESAARVMPEISAGSSMTSLRLGASEPLKIVDGLLTGMHESGTSHRELLSAFAPSSQLDLAYEEASRRDYLGHEFGDLALIFGKRAAPPVSARS